MASPEPLLELSSRHDATIDFARRAASPPHHLCCCLLRFTLPRHRAASAPVFPVFISPCVVVFARAGVRRQAVVAKGSYPLFGRRDRRAVVRYFRGGTAPADVLAVHGRDRQLERDSRRSCTIVNAAPRHLHPVQRATTRAPPRRAAGLRRAARAPARPFVRFITTSGMARARFFRLFFS